MTNPTNEPDQSCCWYCVLTKPHEEKLSLTHLLRQNFDVYLPYIKCKRLYRRKLQWVVTPMFPRYLFLNLKDLECMPKIRSTRGVSSLVSFGNKPAQVPTEVIDEIRSRCEYDVYTVNQLDLNAGDKVEILTGPYQGMKAIFDRNSSAEERVVVLLEIMSTVAKVEVDRELLVKDKD